MSNLVKHTIFSVFRYGTSQEGTSHTDAALKTIYKQLASKQEEIDSLREKVEAMKSLHRDIQILNSALLVS